MIEKTRLDDRAKRYALEVLATGDTLAASLRSVVNDDWEVYALLPSGTSLEAACEFETGGVLAQFRRFANLQRVPNTNEELAAEIERFIASDIHRVCIFEDWITRRDDPSVATAQNVWMFREHVCYVLGHGASMAEIIAAANEAKYGPQVIGVMTSWAGRDDKGSGREIDDQDLEVIVADAEAIIVGAYDGESYLLVERKASAHDGL